MDRDDDYEQHIVQSLIGNNSWSSRIPEGQLYHVGTIPNKKNHICVYDLRFMVGNSDMRAFFLLLPIVAEPDCPWLKTLGEGGSTHSWDMLVTNLSIKEDGHNWSSYTKRFVRMDTKDFTGTGIAYDDLVEAYVQTILAIMAIGKMATNLVSKTGKLKRKLFESFNHDAALLKKNNALKLRLMVRHVAKLDMSEFSAGNVYRLYFDITGDSFGRPVSLPLIIAIGKKPGKTLGLTAAVHGNELNGIKVIHNLIDEVGARLGELAGTIIAVPGVNVQGIHRHSRSFVDGVDLNRAMPGRPRGNANEVFASRFLKHVVSNFDFLVDLHTASFGRVNSFYVRVDLEDSLTYKMAMSQRPQIVLHNKGRDGSLRSAAAKLGVPSITVEVGNPQLFQTEMVGLAFTGSKNLLDTLGMLSHSWEPELEPIICAKSQWIYTEEGGLLEVMPDVAGKVQKGDLIAKVTNIFGETRKTYLAPLMELLLGKVPILQV